MVLGVVYFKDVLQWANVFISLFIIIIAFFFFQKTKPHKDRTPWIILFVAVIMFFIFELTSVLFPSLNPMPELKDFFKTLFVAFILYVFVYENYLITHFDKVTIEKKEDKILQISEEIKKIVDDKIQKDTNSSTTSPTTNNQVKTPKKVKPKKNK